MGGKTSKETNHHSSSHSTKSYPNILRSYARWDHHSSLASHDITRFTYYEMNNLKRHNQFSQNSSSSSSYKQTQSNRLPRRIKDHVDEKPIILKRSQSIKELITAEQLIKKHSERHRSSFSQKKNIEKSFSTTNINQIISSKQIPLDLQLVLINQHDLQNIYQIGKGNFGTVYRALYKGSRDVALKTLKSSHENYLNGIKLSIEESDNNIYEFLHEAYTMTHLKHENLLQILGITFFGNLKQLSLVTDFMKNGSLLDYLRKYRNTFYKSNSKDITLKLNSFVKQIFQAMLYLEEKSIIHRDLAARNCLIGENNILKVADFGLTKLTECGLYKGNSRTIFAVRWSPPEVIFSSKFSSRSDVWSYGITVWEIYSLGERPYGNLNNLNIKNILKNSSENLSRYLPQSKQFGSDYIYTHLILPCLTYNVTLRPRFIDLTDKIYNLIDKLI